jgi:alkylhydroperoxidase family enzyme
LHHHLATSKRAGLTPEDWAALKAGNFASFTPKEQEALAYTDKLTKAPPSVNDEDFVGLKKHFSDSELVDLHLLIGLANLTNRFTAPLGADLEIPEEKI